MAKAGLDSGVVLCSSGLNSGVLLFIVSPPLHVGYQSLMSLFHLEFKF